MSKPFAIGIDIGATKLAFALIDSKGRVIASMQKPTAPKGNPSAVISDIASGIMLLEQKAPGEIRGIGIGTPGQVISEEGIVINAVNLGWGRINLERELNSLLNLDIPIYLMKDADAALLGEYTFGAARGISDLLYVCIGSGLGGAFMVNHSLVPGSNGTAAGIGHMMLNPNGRVCSCGLKGCAETIVSGPGLVMETEELAAHKGLPTTLRENIELNPYIILEAARHGDLLAQQAFSNLSHGFGLVISYCISILNPSMIVVGGGLALAAYDIILPQALDEMRKHALPHTYQELQILPSKLPNSAIGPASLVWYFDKNSV